jgi:plasmid stabilization system protein ParE
MSAPFQFTPQATEDLDTIWWFIAEDNRDAADGGIGNRGYLSAAG